MSLIGRERRLDIISAEIQKGKKADEIDLTLRRIEYSKGLKRGGRTESNFQRRMWNFFAYMITDVEHASREQDFDGVDYFVTLWGGQRIAVQVKSSDQAVEEFRNSPNYLNHFKKIVVINASEFVTKSKFKKQFISELRRIEKLD